MSDHARVLKRAATPTSAAIEDGEDCVTMCILPVHPFVQCSLALPGYTNDSGAIG